MRESAGRGTLGAEQGLHQNNARAAMVLEALALSDIRGLRLVEVVRNTGLSKTAAHRMLSGLVQYGLADIREEDDVTRYYLGDRIFAWTQMAGARFSLSKRIVPHLERLAMRTGDTSYFALRRGYEAVCLGRAEGTYPIKTLTLNVGERRFLGTNTASLAILAFLEDEEIEDILKHIERDRPRPAMDVGDVKAAVASARECGYSSLEGLIIRGMSGIGMPVKNADGRTVAALSVAAITPRLEGERRAEVVAVLAEERDRIEGSLGELLQS